MRMNRVAVLAGGDSLEREVSLASGARVVAALSTRGYQVQRVEIADLNEIVAGVRGVNVVFNCLHGGSGENGTVQLLFDAMELPYTGSGPVASARAMDKPRAREAFRTAGLTVPPGMSYQSGNIAEFCAQAVTTIGLPLVLKPTNQGSSVGVQIARTEAELRTGADELARRFGAVLVEQFIPGRDLTVGILEKGGAPTALPIVEMRPKQEFYDYIAKYTPGMTDFLVPAPLPAQVATRVQQAAVAAHRALRCRGFSRVDFRLGENDTPYVLEVNTIPGMTPTSDLPMAAAAAGITFDELVDQMLQTAFSKEVLKV